MATRKRAASRPAAAATEAAEVAPIDTDMVFDAGDFRPVPRGVSQVLLKITRVGHDQSVSLGVALFEQVTPQSPWIVIAKQKVDNLPTTPEESFLAFSPQRGARYAGTFLGEMHALSLRDNPLELALMVTADGVGEPIEDFGGRRTVADRFCIVRGRTLLEAR
jgi:hypothetical protein